MDGSSKGVIRKRRMVKNSDESDEYDEYRVDSIVDKRNKNGKLEYKVKWSSTWEPSDNLKKCKELVKSSFYFH